MSVWNKQAEQAGGPAVPDYYLGFKIIDRRKYHIAVPSRS